MIVMDLDGTLLKTDSRFSEYTMGVLKKYRQKGLKVIYATARGGSASKMIPSELMDGRIIMNGALAYEGDNAIFRSPVPIDVARNLLLECNSRGLKAAAEVIDMNYSNFNVTEEWAYIKNYEMVDFNHHHIDAEKLYVIVNSNEDVEFLNKLIPEGLYMTVSRDNLAQIMSVDATKSKTISRLAKHWNIGMEEIVAFGDDLNDIDMIEACGMGVAMGNALEEVKKKADHICDTNDNDGIAKWLLANIQL